MYLIQCRDPYGKGSYETYYVNIHGSEKSYTTNPIRAQRFPSLEAAQRQCCGNEHPVKRSVVLEY